MPDSIIYNIRQLYSIINAIEEFVKRDSSFAKKGKKGKNRGGEK